VRDGLAASAVRGWLAAAVVVVVRGWLAASAVRGWLAAAVASVVVRG